VKRVILRGLTVQEYLQIPEIYELARSLHYEEHDHNVRSDIPLTTRYNCISDEQVYKAIEILRRRGDIVNGR